MDDVLLHKELYRREAIECAIKDFQGLADILIIESKNYWKLVFGNCFYSKELTIREFENYVLSVETTRGKRNDL